MTLRARFEAKVDPSLGVDDCHPWQGFIDHAGYGRIRIGGRAEPVGYAHRVAYEFAHGAIPATLASTTCVAAASVSTRATSSPVTIATNNRRGEAPTVVLHRAGRCQRGHDASEASRRSNGGPRAGQVAYCRACRREDRAAR